MRRSLWLQAAAAALALLVGLPQAAVNARQPEPRRIDLSDLRLDRLRAMAEAARTAELLRRYGSAGLWQRTRQQAESACIRVPSEQWPLPVRELLEALRTEGCALEHEGVWLSRRETVSP